MRVGGGGKLTRIVVCARRISVSTICRAGKTRGKEVACGDAAPVDDSEQCFAQESKLFAFGEGRIIAPTPYNVAKNENFRF